MNSPIKNVGNIRVYQIAVISLTIACLFLAILIVSLFISTGNTDSTPVSAIASRDNLEQPDSSIQLVDLNRQILSVQEAETLQADSSFSYYYSQSASVHMHVLSRNQIAPLHLHPDADEVSLVLSGFPEITQLWANGESITTRTANYQAGDLIISPANCGHEWVNTDGNSVQGNLIFAMPTFSGNYYIRDDDQRILNCDNATVWSMNDLPVDEAESLTLYPASDSQLGERLAFHRVSDSFTLNTFDSPAVLLVVRGRGELQVGQGANLNPGQLAVVPAGQAIPLNPENGVTLEFFLFKPEQSQ